MTDKTSGSELGENRRDSQQPDRRCKKHGTVIWPLGGWVGVEFSPADQCVYCHAHVSAFPAEHRDRAKRAHREDCLPRVPKGAEESLHLDGCSLPGDHEGDCDVAFADFAEGESATENPPVSDRHDAIRRLFATRYDNLPESSRRSHAQAGFVHRTVARVSCPDCLANDRQMFGCSTCGGRGYTEERRDRDPYANEHKVLPYGMTVDRHERVRERDRELGRLAQQTREPWVSEADAIADANKRPYGWEQARRRMYAEFDYQALDLALEMLRETLPGVAAMSPRGLDFIDPWMPADIRAPKAAETPKSPPSRNALIRQWDREGKPRRWIQAQTGLGERQVREIINGTKEAAA